MQAFFCNFLQFIQNSLFCHIFAIYLLFSLYTPFVCVCPRLACCGLLFPLLCTVFRFSSLARRAAVFGSAAGGALVVWLQGLPSAAERPPLAFGLPSSAAGGRSAVFGSCGRAMAAVLASVRVMPSIGSYPPRHRLRENR